MFQTDYSMHFWKSTVPSNMFPSFTYNTVKSLKVNLFSILVNARSLTLKQCKLSKVTHLPDNSSMCYAFSRVKKLKNLKILLQCCWGNNVARPLIDLRTPSNFLLDSVKTREGDILFKGIVGGLLFKSLDWGLFFEAISGVYYLKL